METINEELQSTNDEAHATNTEQHRQSKQANDQSDFLSTAVDNLGAALIVLNSELSVVLWNRPATFMWGLQEDDVRGKSFFELGIGLPVGELARPIQEILGKDGVQRPIILEATNRLGKRIKVRANLNPLLGANGDRQGVVLLVEEDA